MPSSRVKRGLNNILSSTLNQIVTVAMGIVIPYLILNNLGSEKNGLLSTVGQLISYLSLLEVGVGTAALQSLYKTIAQEDRQATCAVISATNRFYKRTGSFYLIAVLIMSGVMPFVLKTSLPKTTVMLVMLLGGGPGVINYFFQGKYQILLAADGRKYVSTNITTVMHIAVNFTKILLLLFGFDCLPTCAI